MAVVTVSCVVAVVAGPRLGPLNIRGHHVGRGGAASNNHWREIGMEYLDDEGAPMAVTLVSALGGTGGRRPPPKYSPHDDPGPGDPINPLNGLAHAFTGQSRFALANSDSTPAKSAATPPAPGAAIPAGAPAAEPRRRHPVVRRADRSAQTAAARPAGPARARPARAARGRAAHHKSTPADRGGDLRAAADRAPAARRAAAGAAGARDMGADAAGAGRRGGDASAPSRNPNADARARRLAESLRAAGGV